MLPFTTLRNWLLRPPPEQAHEEDAWRAWLGQRVIGVMLIVACGWILLRLLGRGQLLLDAPAPGWLWLLWLANIALALGSLWALILLERPQQRDRTLLAWTALLWLYAFTVLGVSESARSTHALGLTLLMIASALLLTHRAFIWFAALGVVTVVVLARLDVYAGTRIYEARLSLPQFWAVRILGVTLAAVMLHLYNRTIHHSLNRQLRELRERRETEDALRESQQRYRNFIERTFEGVWLISLCPPIDMTLPPETQADQFLERGIMVDANEAAARMFGAAGREKLIDTPVEQLYLSAPPQAIRAALLELITAGYQRANMEMVQRLPGGGEPMVFLVNISGVIEPGPNGPTLTGLWGAMRDVSVRRQAQNALQRRNEQLAILSRMGAIISTLQDLDGVMRVILERLKDALPLDACYIGLFDGDDYTRIHFALLYDGGSEYPPHYGQIEPGDWLYPVISERRSLIENRSAAEVARRQADLYSQRIADTGRISASLMATPLLVGARLIGLLSVQSYSLDAYASEHIEFLDLAGYQVATAVENARLYEDLRRELHERQRAEAALQELNADLERRVHERTAQMEKAMRELEAFSYSVSHDLRAPLRAIDGYSRFLADDYAAQLGEEGLGFLNNVRKSAQRMGALIDDLLNLSRVTRTEVRMEPADLSEMAVEILNRLHEDHPERQVETRVHPGLTARGDTHLLRLAMQNLLENAWKFTARPDGLPGRIEFGRAHKDGAPAFFVRDNGAGFDMRYVGNLFKPFSRLHAADEFEGTGIGLASVKRVIERHGGRVWAESAPGQGAVFWFTLEE